VRRDSGGFRMLRGMDDPDGLHAISAKRLPWRQRKDPTATKAEFERSNRTDGQGALKAQQPS